MVGSVGPRNEIGRHLYVEKDWDRHSGQLKRVSLTGGVVWNRVVFHSDASFTKNSFRASPEPCWTFSGSYGSSDSAGMLLMLTVSLRETMVIANVAFKPGSSQQGNARLAAVG